jgi:hypothetical protein
MIIAVMNKQQICHEVEKIMICLGQDCFGREQIKIRFFSTS